VCNVCNEWMIGVELKKQFASEPLSYVFLFLINDTNNNNNFVFVCDSFITLLDRNLIEVDCCFTQVLSPPSILSSWHQFERLRKASHASDRRTLLLDARLTTVDIELTLNGVSMMIYKSLFFLSLKQLALQVYYLD
jgi:hypothetical protein